MKKLILAITVVMTVVLLICGALMPATGDNGSPENVTIGENLYRKSTNSTAYRYVWEEGMEPIFNLTPLNSDIFYYDIDSGAGNEFLNIDVGDPSERTIQLNKLTYNTSAFNISFRNRQFGNYSAIGFMGEKYLAAYTDDSKIASKPVNLLSRRILSKVLIDENRNHSLTCV